MKRIVIQVVLVGFLLSLIGLSACHREDSEDANQDRIYTLYELMYDANEDETTIRATFRLGGPLDSKLTLSEGSSVTFNGEEMSLNGFYAYYQTKLTGEVLEGTFVFTDLNGTSYTNDISISSIDFPADMPDIVKSEAYTFDWIGNTVQDNEEVTFSIDGPQESDTYNETENQIGAGTMELTQYKTNSFSTGASILSIERSYETENLSAPSVGGKIITKYTGTKVGMNVQEVTE